jgi:hypothetical protein
VFLFTATAAAACIVTVERACMVPWWWCNTHPATLRQARAHSSRQVSCTLLEAFVGPTGISFSFASAGGDCMEYWNKKGFNFGFGEIKANGVCSIPFLRRARNTTGCVV